MRLVTYRVPGRLVPGLVAHDVVVPLEAAATRAQLAPQAWTTTSAIALSAADRAAVAAAARDLADGGDVVGRFDAIELGAPIPQPSKIICAAANTVGVAAGMGLTDVRVPTFFAKYPNALAGTRSPVRIPRQDRCGFEGEIAVVIGEFPDDHDIHDPLARIAGVMVFNDMVNSDAQSRTSQWTVAKSANGYAPCGPSLVTIDELGRLDDLRVITRLNGVLHQDFKVSDLIFGAAEIVGFLADAMTLCAGDVIALGTGSGVPHLGPSPVFLQEGDVMEIEVPGVGVISNPVEH